MAPGLLEEGSDGGNKDTSPGADPTSKDGKVKASRAGMHLRVTDQPFASRSCSTSPTHQLAAPPGFPPLEGGSATTPTGRTAPDATGGGSARASPTRSRPFSSGGCSFFGGKSSHFNSPVRNRSRTNSLTVEMSGANHFKHLKNHLQLHHNKIKHPPLQHHPTMK